MESITNKLKGAGVDTKKVSTADKNADVEKRDQKTTKDVKLNTTPNPSQIKNTKDKANSKDEVVKTANSATTTAEDRSKNTTTTTDTTDQEAVMSTKKGRDPYDTDSDKEETYDDEDEDDDGCWEESDDAWQGSRGWGQGKFSMRR